MTRCSDQRAPRPTRRRGVTSTEAAIVTLILAIAIMPMYMLFRKTGETTWRSEIAYKAIHVAREELEEIRMMPIFPKPGEEKGPYAGHQEWEPIQGKNVFFRSFDSPTATPEGSMNIPELNYPEGYRGIETRCVVFPPPISDTNSPDYYNTRMVRLEVRWKRKGEAEAKGSSGTQVYHVVVTRRGAGG